MKLKNKRVLTLLLALVMAFNLVLPTTAFAADGNVQLDQSIASLSEAREIKATATFKTAVNAADLTITYGGKALSEWKSWDAKKGDFLGAPFITSAVTVNGNVATVKLNFDLAFGTEDLSPRSIRVKFQKLIGTYDLKITDSVSKEELTVPLKLNAFDDYVPYSEYAAKFKYIEENKKADRYVEITSIGKTADGLHDQSFIIIAKDKATVDKYLKVQVPEMYNNPAAVQKKLSKGDKDYKIAVWFNNVHGDEAPGPDANIALATNFATKDSFNFNLKKADVSDDYPKAMDLKTAKVLDSMILLFNITENPYGKDNTKRVNINDFDLNRDYTYQSQVESQHFAAALNKWAPLSVLDFHGFYNQFIIEPCTGPHNDNYEFDLLAPGLISQAFAFGKAGVGNSTYKSFDIPYVDYKDGFDDANTCYTSTFGIINGALAHTIEIPDLNENSFNALVNGSYGALNYLLNNKNMLANNQLEIYQRGVENLDSRSADNFYTDAVGHVIGRQRGENKNYFPEYYVIPIGKDQKSTSEAVKTLELLKRSGVKIEKLKTDVTVNKKTYPTGSFVISMYQAKRSLANIVLSKGADVSDWGAMYAELVNNFPDMRGFTCNEIRVKNIFKGKTTAAKSPLISGTTIPKVTKVTVKNNSVDSVKAVNMILTNGGKVVQMKDGNFFVSNADLTKVAKGLVLDISKAPSKVSGKTLKKVKVFAVKSNGSYSSSSAVSQLGFALEQMGFELVKDIKNADIIVDGEGDSSQNQDILDAVKAGKPYLATGAWALMNAKDNGLAEGFTFEFPDYSYEGLMKADYTVGNAATAGYGKTNMTYIANGSTILTMPEGAKALVKVSKDKKFFVTGWWPKHDAIKGRIVGAQKGNLYFFGADLANKGHSTFQFRILSNIIFQY